MNILVFAVALVGITAGSSLAVMFTRTTALRWNVIAVPNERSSHSSPVPIGGGIALVAINLGAWAFSSLVHPFIHPQHVLPFIVGGVIIAGVSLWDDLRPVPVPLRFGAQGVAAVILIAGCGYWHIVALPVAGTISLGAIGIVITLFWVVGLTNAYNFIDGVDGMAGGQAVAAGVGWTALGLFTNHTTVAALGALLAATSVGFLIHNWHPATIFMGDVGSTFLGYSFAAIAVIGAQSDPKLALAGVLLVWPAIFDSGFTVLRRIRNGESIFAGHRTFLFHRLVGAGWSHASAATLYIPLPILGAVLAYTWARGNHWLHVFVAIAAAASCLALWLLVRHQERRLDAQMEIKRALEEGAGLAKLEMATADERGEENVAPGKAS